jgi:hypothetical protein
MSGRPFTRTAVFQHFDPEPGIPDTPTKRSLAFAGIKRIWV